MVPDGGVLCGHVREIRVTVLSAHAHARTLTHTEGHSPGDRDRLE